MLQIYFKGLLCLLSSAQKGPKGVREYLWTGPHLKRGKGNSWKQRLKMGCSLPPKDFSFAWWKFQWAGPNTVLLLISPQELVPESIWAKLNFQQTICSINGGASVRCTTYPSFFYLILSVSSWSFSWVFILEIWGETFSNVRVGAQEWPCNTLHISIDVLREGNQEQVGNEMRWKGYG